jgi:hypothetical protein
MGLWGGVRDISEDEAKDGKRGAVAGADVKMSLGAGRRGWGGERCVFGMWVLVISPT